MGNLEIFTGANDNSPAWAMQPHAHGVRSNPSVKSQAPRKRKTRRPLPFGQILAVLPILALCAGAAAWWFSIPAASLIWPAMAVAGILMIVAIFTRQSLRVRNLSALAIIGSLATALTGLANHSGIELYATDLAVLVSCFALFIGWLLKSRTALMLSGLAGLTWLASLYPDISTALGLGAPVSQGWLALFPMIIIGQAALAMTLRSYSTLLITIIAGYGLAFTLSADLPLAAVAGLTFAAAAAHHRLGKAWADSRIFGARLHIIIGWIAAIGAATYIQSLWLNLDTGLALPFWPPIDGWWVALGFTSLALFVSSIIRYKHAQITLTGIFLVSAAALIIPLASVRPDLIDQLFDAIPGLPARPGFGFVIGAALISSGVAWIVNGLRKGETVDIILGAALVGLQGLILLKPGLTNFDLWIVFIVSLIGALCVSGLIAGANLNHAPPARRYS